MSDYRGRFYGATRDLKTNEVLLTFAVDRLPESDFSGDLAISVRPFRKRRTLTANAYYWALIGEISRLTGNTNNYTHNALLRRYGEISKVGLFASRAHGRRIPRKVRANL